MKKSLYRKTVENFKGKGVFETGKISLRYVGRRIFCRDLLPPPIEDYLDSLYYMKDVDLNNPPLFSASRNGPVRINWIIPPFSSSSGGHTTISRQIRHLEGNGHVNRVYIFTSDARFNKEHDIEKTKALMRKYYSLDVPTFLGVKDMLESDAAVATSWETAYPLFGISNTSAKFYFVQDFEPYFFPLSSQYIFAENTYRMGYMCITAGAWLKRIMTEQYGLEADSFDLAYDPNVYSLDENTRRSGNKVVYYARSHTTRRGFELASLALGIVKEKRPDVEIIFFGQEDYPEQPPFDYTMMGILSHEKLNQLYNEATVGLVISLTNYSLIPNEMMASGLPVVDVNIDSTVSIFGDENDKIFLAQPTPAEIAEAIIKLLDDDELRETQSRTALDYVSQFTWDKSTSKVEEIIMKKLSETES